MTTPDKREGTLTVPENAGESVHRAARAFEQGNFSLARRLAGEVLASDPGDTDREIALDLKRRLSPDPVIRIIAGLCILIFLFITLWSITHSH